jgi:ketosteroid isomerase-like protein
MRPLIRAACLIALPLAMIAPAFTSAAEFTAKDLAAEEGKFAAYSVKNGMRAAFLEFFAEQSWLLRPEPVDAKAWLRARPDPAIVLDWKSQRTVRAASGDLGFSTGPWLLRSKTDPNAPAAHGQFFSVWQKQTNGEWKVFIDHGISHGATATPDALTTTPLIALDLTASPPGATAPSGDAEQQFIARGNAAYADVITPRTRLLREGQFPIDGAAAIGEYLKSQEGQWSWTVKLQGASRANDLAYAVGNFTWQPKEGAARKGQYVRVWVREASGGLPPRWTLASEVMTPEPPPKS